MDDPLEQIRRITHDENLDFVGTALQAAGPFAPVFKVFSIAKGVLDKQLNGSSFKLAGQSDFESALDTIWFRRAIANSDG
jgi:hypothetical protein